MFQDTCVLIQDTYVSKTVEFLCFKTWILVIKHVVLSFTWVLMFEDKFVDMFTLVFIFSSYKIHTLYQNLNIHFILVSIYFILYIYT